MSASDPLPDVLLIHDQRNNEHLLSQVCPDHISDPPLRNTARHHPVSSYSPPLGENVLTQQRGKSLHDLPVLSVQLFLFEHLHPELACFVTDFLPFLPPLPGQHLLPCLPHTRVCHV